MKHHQQLIKHDPDNGLFGDCFRTCIACVLDIDCPAQVPHVFDKDGVTGREGVAKMNRWLGNVYGLRFVELPFTGESLDVLLESATYYFGDQRFFLTGKSSAGVGHVVICKDGAVEHCPSGNGIVGPLEGDDGNDYWRVGFLTKVF